MEIDIDIVNEYLKKQKIVREGFGLIVVPAMKCKDGFTMSVQASKGHYCRPRLDCGPWDKVEVGFPSQKEELLIEYAEEPEKPTMTVYGYVPIEIVKQIILKHGGLK